MKQIASTGVVLNRLNFGEADRIITWLTPDHGKMSLLARGVRKQKSKLAGGIELFSESNISFIRGKGEIGTLTSTRLIKYFENIVSDLKRSQLGFDFLKIVNKTVESEAGEEWYSLVKEALGGLDDLELPPELTQLWFNLHWLKLSGHSPNLHTLVTDKPLTTGQSYQFSYDDMKFFEKDAGPFSTDHIKLLRLAISVAKPKALGYIQNTKKLALACNQLTKAMLKTFVQI